jgi:hypothetical protein
MMQSYTCQTATMGSVKRRWRPLFAVFLLLWGLTAFAATPVSEETDEERIERLDGALDASLSEFDGKLLIENEQLSSKVARERAMAGLDEADGQADGGQGSEGSESADGADGQATGGAEEQRGRERDGSDEMDDDDRVAGLERGAEGGSDKAIGGTPTNIPDGRDDDIVARQLREAAENETDPELREKLWDEYRAYKSSGLAASVGA